MAKPFSSERCLLKLTLRLVAVRQRETRLQSGGGDDRLPGGQHPNQLPSLRGARTVSVLWQEMWQ